MCGCGGLKSLKWGDREVALFMRRRTSLDITGSSVGGEHIDELVERGSKSWSSYHRAPVCGDMEGKDKCVEVLDAEELNVGRLEKSKSSLSSRSKIGRSSVLLEQYVDSASNSRMIWLYLEFAGEAMIMIEMLYRVRVDIKGGRK